jgi:hypothetical protein
VGVLTCFHASPDGLGGVLKCFHASPDGRVEGINMFLCIT